jgi:hypothetical protein
MAVRRRRENSRSRVVQEEIFGPPPILEKEDKAQYALLLDRLYADLEPTDIILEEYVHDVAYWTWELRRLRRMRVCLVEAAIPAALSWVLAVPSWSRLSYIGETHEIDVRQIINPVVSEEDEPKFRELIAKTEKMLAEEKISIEDVTNPVAEFTLQNDTTTTRAFLEQLDYVERFDRLIANAESHRNTCIREIERYRAGVAQRWCEKIRDIDADFTVVKPNKARGRKNAA